MDYLLGEQMDDVIEALKNFGEIVDPGHWQGVSTQGHPEMVTHELINTQIDAQIPHSESELAKQCKPNLPWAETEFQERVGGEPHNPHHSMASWPWWNGQIDEKMSHTYSERFWPNNLPWADMLDGVRYTYGGLGDVVRLLRTYPDTRQATFPIFFPEDTGAKHKGRIPCTLHYHFLRRDNQLHLWYPIRSCDAIRHFRDDVYMAGRLCQWMLHKLRREPAWEDVVPGKLRFTAYSFHVHKADLHLL